MTTRQRKATSLLTSDAGRFIKIDRRLRSGGADFQELRGVLNGISPATLKRDLRAMREELGAPILYDRDYGQYRYAGAWPGVLACLTADVLRQHPAEASA